MEVESLNSNKINRPKGLISKNLKRIKSLEKTIQELSILCKDLDPYATISKEHIKLLKKHKITDTKNPFTITNKLLLMIEDSIEELETLKQTT